MEDHVHPQEAIDISSIDKKLDLSKDKKKKEVEKAMSGNIISETVLMGKYRKT
jgi:phosphatidylethanolamine-binding protein (PEBP) family uncharacterized protein